MKARVKIGRSSKNLNFHKLVLQDVFHIYIYIYIYEKMKNEKCLFPNTQEFLHNIFIKSFK